jgi:hypothetical protein
MMRYPDMETMKKDSVTSQYITPEDRARWREILERDGVITDFENLNRRYDGSRIWVRDNARAVRDEKGETLYYEGALQDVTERRQTEERIDQLESIQLHQLLSEQTFREVADTFPGVFKAGMGAEAILEIVHNLDMDKLAADLRHEMQTVGGQRRKGRSGRRRYDRCRSLRRLVRRVSDAHEENGSGRQEKGNGSHGNSCDGSHFGGVNRNG